MNGGCFRLPGVTASGPIAHIVRVWRRCRPPSSRKGPLFPLESTRPRGPVPDVYLPATPIPRFLAPDESGANPGKQNTASLAKYRKLLKFPIGGSDPVNSPLSGESSAIMRRLVVDWRAFRDDLARI